MIAEILGGILVVVILIAFLIIRNLLKQTEQLDDLVQETKVQTTEKLIETLGKMREIDDKGAFEKDDEVGIAFTEIQELINELIKKI